MSKIVTSLVSLLLLTCSTASHASDLKVENAWSPEAPPMSHVMAGYMDVSNNTGEEILIEKITSPQFKSVEMHRTVQEDGMASMVWQPHVHVPVGKVTKLEPGGKHLMLIRPVKPLKAGDTIKLTLHLSTNHTQTVIATVRKD